MNKKLIMAHIAMFMVAFFYASNFTIAKPVMAGSTPYVSPFGFIMMRAIAATVLLWITHLLFIREGIDKADLPRLFLCGALGVAGNQLTFFHGLNLTTPINASLIMLTTPIIVLLVASLVFGESLTMRKIIGIGLGLLGATVLIINNQSDIPDAPNPTLGNIFVGINAIFYAFYLLLVKPLMTKYSPFTTLKWCFLFGTLIVVPFGWSDMMQVEWESMPTNIYLAIGYVLFFVTFLTYVLNGSALKIVKPSVNSTYIYLQPLLASIIAIAAGKDALTYAILLAGLLIFTGVFMVSQRKKDLQPKKVAPKVKIDMD